MKDVSRLHTYVPIEVFPCFGDQPLASGTAFLYQWDGATYLVTNWHNVAGRRPDTYEPLSKATGAIPDTLLVRVQVLVGSEPENQTRRWEMIRIALYADADRQQARWLEHPDYGPGVDLVAIDVPTEFVHATIMPATHPNLGVAAQGIGPGADAFVLGFPVRLYGGEYLPIWKRASMASDPAADVDGLPKMLIDTATRRGMSGSPVFGQVSGLILPEGVKQTDANWTARTYFGLGNKFLGIYSGAYGREPFEAQLGIVWKESAIQQAIRGGRLGASSFSLVPREPDAAARHSFFDWDDWPLPELDGN